MFRVFALKHPAASEGTTSGDHRHDEHLARSSEESIFRGCGDVSSVNCADS